MNLKFFKVMLAHAFRNIFQHESIERLELKAILV